MASDAELLEAWASGDKRAARELLDRHFVALFRFFRNKVADGVEDLVQDTMLACVRGRERFRGDSTFRTYLFATARFVLLGHLKQRWRSTEPLDPESNSVCDLGPSPSAVAVRRAEQRLLLDAIRRIPLDYQIVLELYHWEGFTGTELADALELSETAMRSRLHRAKQELRRQLEQLATSPDLLHSTLGGLDEWARSLREHLVPPASPEP